MCLASQKFVYYSEKNKKMLAGVSVRAEVEIPTDLVFVGHSRQQNTGASWNGGHRLRYYTYVILEGAYLKHAFSSTYGASHGCDSELPETDESRAYGYTSDASEQDGRKNSRDSDPEYTILGYSNLVIEDDYTSNWGVMIGLC